MKLNWGTYILIFILLFVAFMVYLVVKSSEQNTDLVTSDYYAKEIAFQDRIDDKVNTNRLVDELKTTIVDLEYFALTFPNIQFGDNYSGTLTFMRPSDKSMDLSLQIEVDTAGVQLIPIRQFKSGLYHLEASWTKDGQSFAVDKKIVMP